jgi:hypothetical protein
MKEKIMARDMTDFAQQSSERATQAANFGIIWSSEFVEGSFNRSRQAIDGFMRISRKMTEEFDSQVGIIREEMISLTQMTLSNTMEFGEKLARAKEPCEFAEVQSEFLARQVQTLADHTKDFGDKMQQATQAFADHGSAAMAESSRWSGNEAKNVVSRAEQAGKLARTEAPSYVPS